MVLRTFRTIFFTFLQFTWRNRLILFGSNFFILYFVKLFKILVKFSITITINCWIRCAFLSLSNISRDEHPKMNIDEHIWIIPRWTYLNHPKMNIPAPVMNISASRDDNICIAGWRYLHHGRKISASKDEINVSIHIDFFINWQRKGSYLKNVNITTAPTQYKMIANWLIWWWESS